MKFLVVLFLCLSSISFAQQLVTMPIPGAPGLYVTVGIGGNSSSLVDLRNNPAAVNVTMGDDDNRLIPLGFSFPYFNQIFTESWMHSNGVVSFQNPSLTGNFCCSGTNLTTETGSGFNYAIMPLWTDLIGSGSNNHYYLQGTNEITYGWYNVNEYGTQNANNFEVKLNSAGLVDVRLQGALVSVGRPVTSGMTGNLAQGEYFQYYHGSGWNTGSPMSWIAYDGTSGNICSINPLSSPSCPGYASAYFTQQCIVSALYDPTCPGYTEANFTYQCSINPLYNQLCPGYAEAYALQQVQQKQKEEQPIQTTNVETETTNTAGPSASPANVTTAVPLVSAPAASSLVSTSVEQKQSQQKKEQQSKPATRAQQLQQARMEAAKKEAAAKGKESMKEALEAKTLEQQVATQGLIITAMSYNPNFDAYGAMTLKDSPFYKLFDVYKDKNNVDNNRALRGLYGPSENRHQQLINSQYK